MREYQARTLLIHHRWDVEKLFAVFAEEGRTSLFADAGVTVVDHCDLNSSLLYSTVTCNICYDDVSRDEVSWMDCGHSFCNSCWIEYFIVKINEGQSRNIRCMAHKCNAVCDESIVRFLVRQKSPHLANKFERFLLESYIEDNKMVKWCPSVPHCGNAIRVEDDEICEVECSCGMQFCFRCSAEAHSPCSCIMWEHWAKMCRNESENMDWIAAHTKPCPKCQKPVEKNGGCNLVTCQCMQHFCWLCGGPTGGNHTWTSIVDHSCGRYEEDKKKNVNGKQVLNRLTHYYSRYNAHTESFKLESKLKETISEKVSNIEEKGSSLRDCSWVMNGLSRLFRSRRVLSYSYPFAFYMFGEELFGGEMTSEEREIRQNLFEDQQQQLEFKVENLSMLLEEPFDDFTEDRVMNTRMQVMNLGDVVDSLCRKMYECIENDLLGSHQLGAHEIAPYRSEGIEQASGLSTFWSLKGNAT